MAGFWRRLGARLRGGETALCMNSSYFGFFAHAGFLSGLLELGIRPTRVSGASAGALVAGTYAGGVSPDDMGRLFLDPKLARVFFEWQAPARMSALLIGRAGYTGAFSGKRVLRLLKEVMGEQRIEDLREPRLSVSVANLTTKRSQLIEAGPLAEYVLASCAMPGLFQMQSVNGDLLWDGGIADPAPFEHWIDDPKIKRIIIHQVIALDLPPGRRPAHKNRKQKRDRGFGFYGALNHSHEIISEEIIRLKVKLAEQAGKEVLMFRTETPKLGPHRLKHGRANLELGRRAVLDHADAFA